MDTFFNLLDDSEINVSSFDQKNINNFLKLSPSSQSTQINKLITENLLKDFEYTELSHFYGSFPKHFYRD